MKLSILLQKVADIVGYVFFRGFRVRMRRGKVDAQLRIGNIGLLEQFRQCGRILCLRQTESLRHSASAPSALLFRPVAANRCNTSSTF